MLQIIDISKDILYDEVKAQSEFLSLINVTVSHEMRNPLNSIINKNTDLKFILDQIERYISRIEVVEADLKEESSNAFQGIKNLKLQSNLSHFHSEIVRVSKIQHSSSQLLLFFVNDIIDFARIRSKNFKKVISTFDIKEAIDEIIEI